MRCTPEVAAPEQCALELMEAHMRSWAMVEARIVP